MTLPAQQAADLYHYSENGTPRGPFTVQQLQDLAASGKIQPQTFVWKAGFQAWVPAKSVRGLLPKAVPSPRPPAYPATMLERKRVRSHRPRWIIVGSIVVAAVLVLGSLAGAVVLLIRQDATPSMKETPLRVQAPVNQGHSRPKPPAKAERPRKKAPLAKEAAKPLPPPEKKDSPPKKTEPPKKTAPPRKPEPPPPPPVEFAVLQLLTRYKEDPKQLLKEVEGKPVTLKMQGTWNVDSLQKAIRDGVLILRYTRNATDKKNLKPHETIRLVFPLVNPGAKLGFFAKIEAYAKQRKKGERVVMNVTGTLTTTFDKDEKFLVLDNATLK